MNVVSFFRMKALSLQWDHGCSTVESEKLDIGQEMCDALQWGRS